MTAFRRIVATVALVASVFGIEVADAVSAQAEDLIVVDPGEVRLAVPAPGHETEWTMTAQNLSDSPVPLGLSITGVGGDVFGGPHPLEVAVFGPDGETLFGTADVLAAIGDPNSSTLELPDLDVGSVYTVRGRAELPYAAGDEYRSVGGDITFRFVASADDRPSPVGPAGNLPQTGAGVLTPLIIAVALIGIGMAFYRTRRRSA